VKGIGFLSLALKGIHAPEPACPLVIISGAVEVDAQHLVKLLTGKQIIVRRCAGPGDQIAEGVIVVCVCDGAGRVGEEAD
jgi:hypothetical protein